MKNTDYEIISVIITIVILFNKRLNMCGTTS
jgi:hypothetical protein